MMANIDPMINNADYWKNLFQESPVGLCFVGKDGEFLKVNNAMCSILGYTDIELTGKTFQSVTHPDDLRVDVEMSQKLIRKEATYYEMNKRYLHKMGGSVWVKLTVHPIFDENGVFNHFVSHVSPLLNGERLKAEYSANNNSKIVVRPTISLGEFWKDNWKTLSSISIVLLGTLFGTYFQVLDTNYKQDSKVLEITTQIEHFQEDIQAIKDDVSRLPTIDQIKNLLNEDKKSGS